MCTYVSSFSNVYLSWLHPSEWKVHLITPILKSGKSSNVANYRPISLLCSVSKVFEKVLFESLSNNFLPYISTQQFGFVKGRSCFQQVLTTMISLHHILDFITLLTLSISISKKHSIPFLMDNYL